MTERRLGLWIAIAIVTGMTLMPVAAGAAQQRAEPALLSLGWWWEEAQTEETDIQGNKVVVGSPNPFCPGAGNGLGAVHPAACAEGKLPVEIIGGDYETPNKLSALGFDLSYLTPGSEVISFTVKLLEAEAGCYGRDGGAPDPADPEGNHCEQTDPTGPIDDRQIQACIIPEIFGDAEAAPYKEVPPYECSDTDPVASRKEIKTIDPDTDTDEIDHVWEFDLTDFAQGWADEFTVATNIMVVGVEPEATDQSDSWRVVFAGPKTPKGIITELVYEPGEITLPPPPPPPGTPSGSGFTGGTGTSTTDFGTGSTDFGTGSGTGTGAVGGAPAPGASPSAAPGEELAGDTLPASEGLPPYVWLALLAGLIGFALVRQVVIESATGIRPDGVLAKIHALNADRRGELEVAATAPGPMAVIGAKVRSLVGKLPFGRKG